ncbi:hypothetical protein N7478_005760 [Penicillium angulare]|uniref:uncharacterized protein n=1 Tax=Penicillium angulare TaxID=116970 RepID=UPI0025417197|nr:uncharacterized protein N7478_005760 [Penicillium angulare]KAJ5280388.1 hypothetical protein N7478_005760 [Penicillium angulare]
MHIHIICRTELSDPSVLNKKLITYNFKARDAHNNIAGGRAKAMTRQKSHQTNHQGPPNSSMKDMKRKTGAAPDIAVMISMGEVAEFAEADKDELHTAAMVWEIKVVGVVYGQKVRQHRYYYVTAKAGGKNYPVNDFQHPSERRKSFQWSGCIRELTI